MEIYNDTYCVYIHTNLINGKMYVGQTIYGNNPNLRWLNGEGYKTCTSFYRAIQKYGWNNFNHEIIANNLTVNEANYFEELLIDKLNTRNSNNGYNLKSGGSHGKHSEETKKKISKINKGQLVGEKNPMYGIRQFFTEEIRNKISKANKGRHFSEEHKAKLSESLKGERNPMYGKHPSEQTIQKMKESHRGEKNPMYGKVHTKESKDKISQARKGKNVGSSHPKARKVICLETNEIYGTIQEASKKTNIHFVCIVHCCKGEQKTTGGFHWKYYDNGDSLCQ